MKKMFLSPLTYLTFLLVFVFSQTAFSQDDIIMRNNDVIKAKVEEVGVNVIKYRKADNMDGPIYDMPKADVYMIVYNNGTRDVINARQTDAPPGGDDIPAPVTVREAPPQMPEYEQPPCPVEGYLWTPGYWAYGPGGYFWVPGVWVNPPRPGYLWTPGYWGFANGYFGWHEGYWGEHVGFYGGVHYGYGYEGEGYYGGRWEGREFRYNTAVSRVDVTVVHTTYVDNTVVVRNNNTVVNRSSYNGDGGVRVEATPAERRAMNENHVNHTPEQRAHLSDAKNDKGQYVSANQGRPATTTMNKANGQHFSSEGHVTTTSNPSHPAMETKPSPSHGMPNEQRKAEPVQQHPAQTTQPQHTQPVQQQRTEPGLSHPANEPRSVQQPAQSHPGPTTQQHAQPVQQQHPAPVQQTRKTATARPAPKAAPAKNEERH